MQLRRFPLAAAAALALSPVAASQTWMVDVEMDTEYGVDLAVSDGGRIATLVSQGPAAATEQVIQVFGPDGALESEFAVDSFQGDRVELEQIEFLDEDTVVASGSYAAQPYMGAFDVETGVEVWESSLEGSGSMDRLERNHLGQFIAGGDLHGGGYLRAFVCSVSPQGGMLWFREYSIAPGNSYLLDIESAANGDLLLVLGKDSEVIVTRTTDYGHVIESHAYAAADGYLSSISTQATESGGLLIACTVTPESAERRYGLFEVDAAGDIEWARSYEAPQMDHAAVGGVEFAPDGDILLGLRINETIGFEAPSPAVVRLDAAGDPRWARRYGSLEQAQYRPWLHAMPDGGFVGLSSRGYWGTRLFRANRDGDVGPCATGYVSFVPGPLTIEESKTAHDYTPYPGGLDSLHATPVLFTSQHATVCAEDCRIVGGSYGDAAPGSFGIEPTLAVTDGLCLTFGPELEVGAGVGGSVGVVGYSAIAAAVPLFGGTLYLNPATMYFLPPFVLDGAAGIPGVGATTISLGGGDLSNLLGHTVHLQAFLIDAGAPAGWSMTPAATLTGI